jgi:predicted deacetylase
MLHEPPALPGLPPPFPAAPGSGPFLVVCFDGLAPHSQRACQEFLPQLAQAGVPRVSFLLLPSCEGARSVLELPYFSRWVRSLAEVGHEICLRGEPKASDIAADAPTLCARLGVPMAGFVPSSGPLSAEARRTLADRGFSYVMTAAGLDLLPGGKSLPAPAVSLSGSSWRVPAAWVRTRLLCSARRSSPVLRLDVDPRALYEPSLRQTLLTLVREALLTRTPATCGDLAASAAAS